MNRAIKIIAITAGALTLLAVVSVYGASAYYTLDRGQGCADCHEMRAYVSAVHSSSHRSLQCMQCHEADLATKLRHVIVHLRRDWPETIRLREQDMLAITVKCRNCHQREFAQWQAGPHSVNYQQIFTGPAHNSSRHLMEDCLRCHGMYFAGSIRDLVQPQNTLGAWHLVRTDLADQPTIPCGSCHWIHRRSQPEARPSSRFSLAGPPVSASLALYDRREQMHFAATALPIPQLHDGPRLLHVSQDPRQAVCYQCHAPHHPETGTAAAANSWGTQAGTGDDRTPMGVHEGLSCFSCHTGHHESARASCKTCHPQLSNCGLDVETMDTTFANAKSTHNIHWVKCENCHQHGVPKPKPISQIGITRPALSVTPKRIRNY